MMIIICKNCNFVILPSMCQGAFLGCQNIYGSMHLLFEQVLTPVDNLNVISLYAVGLGVWDFYKPWAHPGIKDSVYEANKLTTH